MFGGTRARPATLGAVLLVLIAGCGTTGPPPPLPQSTPAPYAITDPDVIDFTGARGVHFGETLTELVAAGFLSPTPSSVGCGRRFAGFGNADPVFEDDRLALIWAYPPLHTPEGVMVGTPLEQVKAVYPGAAPLLPPPGSYAFEALLVRGSGGSAYLILHDSFDVQKLIVGSENAARALYTDRLDAC